MNASLTVFPAGAPLLEPPLVLLLLHAAATTKSTATAAKTRSELFRDDRNLGPEPLHHDLRLGKEFLHMSLYLFGPRSVERPSKRFKQVPGVGFEPTRAEAQWCLRPSRLPDFATRAYGSVY